MDGQREIPESTLEVDDAGVATFTLNRPTKMNALSQAMFDHDLPEMVARAERDDAIRAVVITGAGGHFCSGADVTRMQKKDGAPDPGRASNLRGAILKRCKFNACTLANVRRAVAQWIDCEIVER